MSKPDDENSKDGRPGSARYQDFVICEGQFVGQFDSMYRNSSEVPWHQDKTVNSIFSDLTVALLKARRVRSLLDVGCGLGYMTDRLRREIPGLERVVGIDVSETAISRAREMFPEIEFLSGKPQAMAGNEKFEAVASKDVLWYVLDDLAGYIATLARRSSRWVYLGQSFPESRPFYGEDILPDAEALLKFLDGCGQGRVAYSLIERDAAYGGRQYAHVLIEAASQ